MDFLKDLSQKKIAVVGYGKEGQSTLRFLIRKGVPLENIIIADKKEQQVNQGGVKTFFGNSYLQAIENVDIIIRSPGVPLHLICKKDNQIITSQSDIFLSKHYLKTIGITGTKGKSSTAKMIYDVLTAADIDACLVGNIGNPALDYFDKDCGRCYFIYELSSFQLQNINNSPHIAIFLNLFPDHLDKHTDIKEYIEAKKNITRFQGKNDILIFNGSDKVALDAALLSKAQKKPFFATSEPFCTSPTAPVKLATKLLGISHDIIEEAIKNFKPLPHRYEYLGTHNGIDFYNDSAATVPEATIAAINSTSNIKTLIVGGSDKGSSTKSLVEKIKSSTIDNIVILQGTPDSFIESIGVCDKKIFTANNMNEAVDICFKETPLGGACVLSPGFASFNMFTSQGERGDSFRNLVFAKANEQQNA